MNNDVLFNLKALTEVFLENKEKEIEDVDEFIVTTDKKDDTYVEFETNKINLFKILTDIFSKSVDDLKSVSIYYIKNGERVYLNGISIF